ncbi:MAG: GlcG/HbpS family heme-binding protein [Rubrivivax sp.]
MTKEMNMHRTSLPTLATSLALLLGAALQNAGAQTSAATFNMRFMSPETALKAAQATLASCRTQGFQVAVAVVDRTGIAQVLLRDRFAGAHTPDMALGKAWTAASFRRNTAELAVETQAGRPMSGIRGLPRVIAAGGGVPIDEGGTLWGAIGVSGGPGGDADESCARAGIKAVADELSF